MKIKTITLFCAIAMCAGNSLAQEAELTEGEMIAKQRAQAYADALGLDARATGKLARVYADAEAEVAPLRDQCTAIKTKVEAALAPYDAKVEALLTKEQRTKLATMKADGSFVPGDGCCVQGGGHAGCAGHAAAAGAAGGCCAGKAGAHGEAAPVKRTPTPTLEPDPK